MHSKKSKKKEIAFLISFFIGFTVLFYVIFSVAIDNKSPYKEFKDFDRDFKVDYPNDWNIQTQAMTGTTIFTITSADHIEGVRTEFAINKAPNRNSEEITLEAYSALLDKSFNRIPGFVNMSIDNVVNTSMSFFEDSVPGFKAYLTYYFNEMEMKSIAVYSVYQGYVYTFYFSSPIYFYENHEQYAEHMLNSFQLVEFELDEDLEE